METIDHETLETAVTVLVKKSETVVCYNQIKQYTDVYNACAMDNVLSLMACQLASQLCTQLRVASTVYN